MAIDCTVLGALVSEKTCGRESNKENQRGLYQGKPRVGNPVSSARPSVWTVTSTNCSLKSCML